MSRETAASEQSINQNILKDKLLVVFVILLGAFPPLSLDMNLPALPTMAKHFGTTEAVMNLTLIVFFIVYAIASLIWGALSDKYGRKPVLIIGVLLYLLGSFLCSIAGTAAQLIAFRVIQGLGGGVTLTVSTAIVRDVYTGRKQETILSVVQSMTMICPVAAPIIGAILLNFTSWRGIYCAQAVFGTIVAVGTFLFTETIKGYGAESIVATLGRLVAVSKKPSFIVLTLVFHPVSIGLMVFVTSSAYIFQDYFGISPQVYSYFFSINAVGMVAGPLLYILISKQFRRNTIVKVCFFILLISGVLVAAAGAKDPWLFSFLLLPASLAGSCIRPPGTFLLLSMHQNDIGSASAVVTFSGIIFGSIGMITASLLSFNMITTIGVVNLLMALISGGIWIRIEKKYPDRNT